MTVMKILARLQDADVNVAYRIGLRAYAQIGLLERGKPRTRRAYTQRNVRKEKNKIYNLR